MSSSLIGRLSRISSPVSTLFPALVLASAFVTGPLMAEGVGYLSVATDVSEVWSEGSELALEPIWERPLGPSYSSPVAADGKVFVTFSRGELDVLAAFRQEDGDELWSVELGPRYRGHDGSEDGPLSTPWVTAERVVAVSAGGRMVAVSPEDGSELWSRELMDEAVELPFYGFASSPRQVGEHLVIQTPGKTGARLLNAADGAEVIRFNDDGMTYQSPWVTSLAGQEQILVTGNRRLEGWSVDGKTRLWSFEHKEKGAHESAQALPVGDDRLLLVLDQESVLLRVQKGEAGFEVEELWRAGVFKSTDARPVVHGDLLYGFSGNIFSAVKVADGSLAWRSRDLSGSNLGAVPERLVQLTRKGELVVAAPTADGLGEQVRLKVFERGDYGNPAVDGDLIFVRNQELLAALRVAGAAPAAGEAAGDEPASDENGALEEAGGASEGPDGARVE